MPIYAYRCASCGHQKDVLQKMSDAQLTICPECQADSFRKQVTAAGFQLKGNGWYATDFKNNGQAAKSAESTTSTTAAPGAAASTESKAAAPAAPSTPSSGAAPAST